MTGRAKTPDSGVQAFCQETGVSRETRARLEAYVDLLTKWQRRINLIGPGTLPNIWHRHLLDSAQLSPLIEDYARRQGPNRPLVLVDLGSGAGLPGLVLAILFHGTAFELEVHLVESDQRKCVFLREAARVTGVDVKVHGERIEDMDPFDAHIVTARACAPLDRLLGYAAVFWCGTTEGLFLKGQDIEKERVQAAISWGMVAKSVPSRSRSSGTVLWVQDLWVHDLRKGGA